MKAIFQFAIRAGLLCLTFGLNSQVAAADRALLIGVGQYQESQQISSLAGPANDLVVMKKLLTEKLKYPVESIKVLQNEQASAAAIRAALSDWLVKQTVEGDRVFFYFSGHGFNVPDVSGDEKDGLDEVLITFDTTVDRNKKGLSNLIIDDELDKILTSLKGRITTFVVDSCHSGSISRTAFGEPDIAISRTPNSLHGILQQNQNVTRSVLLQAHREEQTLVKAEGRSAVWTAVSSYQEALDDIEQTPVSGHFSNRFARGVGDREADLNRDGSITHAELLDWLRQEGQKYCDRQKRACRTGLTPTLDVSTDLLLQPVETTLLATPLKELNSEQAVQASFAASNQSPNADDQPLNIRLEIVNGKTNCKQHACVVKLGATLKFSITANFSGYLTLLDLNSENKITPLFPNQYSKNKNPDGLIVANRKLTVPDQYYGFEFEASPPLGEGQILALVTKDKINLSDILPLSRSLTVLSEDSSLSLIEKITERLRKTWPGDEQNRQVMWQAVVEKYRIE